MGFSTQEYWSGLPFPSPGHLLDPGIELTSPAWQADFFLPRSKHLLISWLQSQSALILEPPKLKSVILSIVSPSICHEVMGLDAMIFIF